MNSLFTHKKAIAADAARYSAQLDGSCLAHQTQLETECGNAWRAHAKQCRKEFAYSGPSESQALGFTSLD